jgi:hypothetical protein
MKLAAPFAWTAARPKIRIKYKALSPERTSRLGRPISIPIHARASRNVELQH